MNPEDREKLLSYLCATYIVAVATAALVIAGKIGFVILVVGFVQILFLIGFVVRLIVEALVTKKKIITSLFNFKLYKIANFLYSPKTCKEIFEPIISDFLDEYQKAIKEGENWKARWINLRYAYAFLIVMWEKSPMGEFMEFIRQFAK